MMFGRISDTIPKLSGWGLFSRSRVKAEPGNKLGDEPTVSRIPLYRYKGGNTEPR